MYFETIFELKMFDLKARNDKMAKNFTAAQVQPIYQIN